MEIEKRVVLLLIQQSLSFDETEELKELLYTHMNWSIVFGLIHAHRVGGIVYKNLQHNIVEKGYDKFLLNKFYFALQDIYRLQKARTLEQLNSSIDIFSKLEEKGIHYCVLKGHALTLGLYKDLGCRDSNDTDILVHSSQLQKALDILKENGYIQGRMSKADGKIIPEKRKNIIIRPLVSHEVIPLQKMVKGAAIIDYHEIDLQFSIALMTNNRTDNLVQEFLDRRIRIEGEYSFYSLSWEDHLLFLCIHFYKEATTDYDVVRYNDLSLYKMIDVVHILISNININKESFLMKAKLYDLEQAINFTFFNVNKVFPNIVPAEFLSNISTKSLNNVYVYNTQEIAIKWSDDLIDRIFNMNRAKLVRDSRLKEQYD